MAPGKRTVTAALRIMGLSQERHFQNYHRALNQAVWSNLVLSLILLRLLLSSGVALLFSSRGYMKPELLACVAMRFLPKRFRPSVVLYGEMFQPDNGILGRIERFIMKLVDRSVCFYVVYSTAELELFPNLWGVDRSKMRFCTFYLGYKRLRRSQSR